MTDLKTRINAEIESVEQEMEQAKHQIKHNTAKGLLLTEPEQVEESQIKKQKLRLKDRMEDIVRRGQVS